MPGCLAVIELWYRDVTPFLKALFSTTMSRLSFHQMLSAHCVIFGYVCAQVLMMDSWVHWALMTTDLISVISATCVKR